MHHSFGGTGKAIGVDVVLEEQQEEGGPNRQTAVAIYLIVGEDSHLWR